MTIDERATSYSEMLYDEYETRLAQDTAYEGYIKGATEQREIDIKKACEWLNEILYEYVSTTTNGLYEEFTKEEFIEVFRKAMEEE